MIAGRFTKSVCQTKPDREEDLQSAALNEYAGSDSTRRDIGINVTPFSFEALLWGINPSEHRNIKNKCLGDFLGELLA